MKVFFALVFFVTLLSACRQEVVPNSQITNNNIFFFDVKGYFEQEIQRLKTARPKVYKKVAVNDDQEEKQIDNVDFDKELAVFIESDINRIDWKDKYRADSTIQNQQLAAIRYTAQNDKLRTRQLDVTFQNGKVSKVFIQNGGKTMIAGSQQELTYLPEKGYFIQSKQRTAISKDRVLRVEVELRY